MSEEDNETTRKLLPRRAVERKLGVPSLLLRSFNFSPSVMISCLIALQCSNGISGTDCIVKGEMGLRINQITKDKVL